MKILYQQVEFEIKPKNSFSLGFMELWQYRDLFLHFTKRDIKVRYRHAVLGFLWAVLQPFLLMVVFTFVFKKGLSLQTSTLPYPIFSFSGLIVWLFFSNGVNGSANSLVRNSTILQKIYFPRLVLPLSAIATGLFDFLFGWVLLMAMSIYFGLPLYPLKILGLTLGALLLAGLATTSLGLLLAALNAKYRDFQYVLPFLLQLLFFASPLFYDHAQLGASFFKEVLNFNPLAGPLHLIRISWTGEMLNWELTFSSTLASLILFAIGIYAFKKMEAYFADLA